MFVFGSLGAGLLAWKERDPSWLRRASLLAGGALQTKWLDPADPGPRRIYLWDGRAALAADALPVPAPGRVLAARLVPSPVFFGQAGSAPLPQTDPR